MVSVQSVVVISQASDSLTDDIRAAVVECGMTGEILPSCADDRLEQDNKVS